MVLFYTNNIIDNTAYFDAEESRHISQALRKDTGAELFFVDGKGTRYKGIISLLSKKGIQVSIISKELMPAKRKFQSHIAIAPTKNMDRIEWFLEKSIEIGIDEISFILCKHSERKVLKMDRLERIAVAAMKQSMNTRIPILNPLQDFETFVSTSRYTQRLIAAVTEQESYYNQVAQADSDICCLIGPEGGFRDTELEFARNHGFTPVSLGDRRLRTETAGIVAASYAHEKLKSTY